MPPSSGSTSARSTPSRSCRRSSASKARRNSSSITSAGCSRSRRAEAAGVSWHWHFRGRLRIKKRIDQGARMPRLCAAFVGYRRFITTAAQADEVAEFYKGKRVTLLVSYGPGGGYDVYARVLARHIGRHIPGNPNIVVQNMPGAGSLRGANYLYNVAPKDGTYFGTFARNMPMLGLLKSGQNVQFDPREVHLARLVVEPRERRLCPDPAPRRQGEDDRGRAPRRRPADHPRQHGRRHLERRHGRADARMARLQPQGDPGLHRLRRAVPGDRARRGRRAHRRAVVGESQQGRTGSSRTASRA